MANTTRFEINREKTDHTFESVKDHLLSLNGQALESRSAQFNNIFIEETKNSDEVEVDEVQLKEDFNGKEFSYNFFSIKYDYSLLGDSESKVTDQLIILYEHDDNIYIIIDKNTGASALLRLFLGFTKDNLLTKKSHNVSSNLIIWLIYKIYKTQNEFRINTEILTLSAVIGFKGDTNDQLNTITATGDSLMNILSTLSFLLESNSLSQISLRLEYTNHKTIEIKLDTNDSLGISYSNYQGAFKKEPYKDISEAHQESLVYLFVYTEIFPIIKQWYMEDQEEQKGLEDLEDLEDLEEVISRNKWDEIEHRKFLEEVAKDLTEKINFKVSNLKDIISQI